MWSAVVAFLKGIAVDILWRFLKEGGAYLYSLASKAVSKMFRSKKQDEAVKQVEQDVQSGDPRTDETRKHESDWINS